MRALRSSALVFTAGFVYFVGSGSSFFLLGGGANFEMSVAASFCRASCCAVGSAIDQPHNEDHDAHNPRHGRADYHHSHSDGYNPQPNIYQIVLHTTSFAILSHTFLHSFSSSCEKSPSQNLSTFSVYTPQAFFTPSPNAESSIGLLFGSSAKKSSCTASIF